MLIKKLFPFVSAFYVKRIFNWIGRPVREPESVRSMGFATGWKAAGVLRLNPEPGQETTGTAENTIEWQNGMYQIA